jgi:hypothetical protein
VYLLEGIFFVPRPDTSRIRLPGCRVREGVPNRDAFRFDIFLELFLSCPYFSDDLDIFGDVEFGVEVSSGGCEASYAGCCCWAVLVGS